MINVPRFSVVINGVEVVREWGWDRVFEVKEELKRLGFVGMGPLGAARRATSASWLGLGNCWG
jgi:hypothetical protein